MSKLKVGDLVRVIKRAGPGHVNHHIDTSNMRGFIEEIVGENAQFVELKPDGLGGGGGIPLSCLQLDDSEDLRFMKHARDEKIAKYHEEGMRWTRQYHTARNKAMTLASKETGVDLELVERIFKIVDEFDRQSEYHQGSFYE